MAWNTMSIMENFDLGFTCSAAAPGLRAVVVEAGFIGAVHAHATGAAGGTLAGAQ